MWRTRKCALGRSALRMWRAASRVGWREREEMVLVREAEWGWEGGRRGARWVVRRRV